MRSNFAFFHLRFYTLEVKLGEDHKDISLKWFLILVHSLVVPNQGRYVMLFTPN